MNQWTFLYEQIWIYMLFSQIISFRMEFLNQSIDTFVHSEKTERLLCVSTVLGASRKTSETWLAFCGLLIVKRVWIDIQESHICMWNYKSDKCHREGHGTWEHINRGDLTLAWRIQNVSLGMFELIPEGWWG